MNCFATQSRRALLGAAWFIWSCQGLNLQSQLHHAQQADQCGTPFPFKDLRYQTKLPVPDNPQPWQHVMPGMNWLGVCPTLTSRGHNPCRAAGQEVWVNHGFWKRDLAGIDPQVLNVSTELRYVHCPLCGNLLQEVYACGLYRCMYVLQGSLRTNTGQAIKVNSGQQQISSHKDFIQHGGQHVPTIVWQGIRLKVDPLPEEEKQYQDIHLAVLWAMQNKQPAALDSLLKHHIKINQPNSSGDTLLHLAVKQQNPRWVARLLELGANVRLVNHMRKTPVKLLPSLSKATNPTQRKAIRRIKFLFMEPLLDSQPSMKDQLEKERTAWSKQTKNSSAKAQKFRNLQQSYKVIQSITGCSSFAAALWLTHHDVAHYMWNVMHARKRFGMLKQWAQQTDFAHCTPLHFAAANDDLDLARKLLEAGANPNVTSSVYEVSEDCGTTPLCLAAQHASKDMVKLLLEHQADPLHSESTDVLPIACALEAKRGDTAVLLAPYYKHIGTSAQVELLGQALHCKKEVYEQLGEAWHAAKQAHKAPSLTLQPCQVANCELKQNFEGYREDLC